LRVKLRRRKVCTENVMGFCAILQRRLILGRAVVMGAKVARSALLIKIVIFLSSLPDGAVVTGMASASVAYQSSAIVHESNRHDYRLQFQLTDSPGGNIAECYQSRSLNIILFAYG
jgi:hypothetical protein